MRVIAGRFRGRRLKAPKGEGVRPTADRVKEALFSILGDLSGLRALDLFAGTGALGIEALSRGAQTAVFVESASASLAAIRANLTEIGLSPPEAVVVHLAVARMRPRLGELAPFDLVFADPPYAELALAPRAADDLAHAGLVREGARLVIEHASRDRPSCSAWTEIDRRDYGDTALTLFTVNQSPSSSTCPDA